MIPIEMYRRAATRAAKTLVVQWQILPASILLWFAARAVSLLTAPLGMVGGFIAGMVQIAALSLFYFWLDTASSSKTSFKRMLQFDYQTFSTTINAAFFIWLIQFSVNALTAGAPGLAWTELALGIVLLVALNALPEMAYVAKVDGIHVLQDTFEFMQRRWLEWLLPTLIIILPVLAAGKLTALSVLSGTNVMLPIYPIFAGLSLLGLGTPGVILGIVIGVWFMLFRKELFEQLISRGV